MTEIVLTGLAYVFAVLGVIVLFILLLSLVSRAIENRKKKPVRVNKTRETTVVKVKTGNDDAEKSADERTEKTSGDIDGGKIDPKVICALTAAIDAFESENGKRRFKVLSFRRVGRN